MNYTSLLAFCIIASVTLVGAAPAQAANCSKRPDHPKCTGGGGGDDGDGGGGSQSFEPAIVHAVGFNFSRSDLYLMNQDGSESRILLEGARSVGYGGPSWSPDGNSIAFVQDVGDPGGLYTINVDGTSLYSRFVETATESVVGSVAWRPGSQEWLAFGVSQDDEEDFDVFVTSPSGGVATNLTGHFPAPAVDGQNVSLELDPAWSFDGGLIAIRRIVDFDFPWEMQILVCAFDDEFAPSITCPTAPNEVLVPIEEAKDLSGPAWHPVNNQLAYAAAFQAVDGNQPKKDLLVVKVSTDGSTVSTECNHHISTADAPAASDTGCDGPEILPFTEFGNSVAWSCDGGSLLVHANGDEGWGIYGIDLASTPISIVPLRFPQGKERSADDMESRRGCP